MNKEEILAKSRSENKEKDLFEKDVQVKAGNIGACTATVLATVFVVSQMFVGGGMNYGFYAIVFSVQAAAFIVKAIRMKRRNDIIFAVIHTVVVSVFSISHIINLIVASPNL